MCIDYTDLNIHCPKDPFPLPRIDQVVDSTTGSVLLSFLDCNSGYHQIALHPNDEDKTMFITPHGIYCYKVMTFGLKNAGATYQKAIQKCFFLVYGSEAVLPTDVAFGAPQIQFYEEGEAELTRRIDLDSLEEQRLTAVMRQARHDQQLRLYHGRNVQETSFNVGDLILRRIQMTDGMHKLSAPWEGPFIVTKVVSPSKYRLEWGNGQGVPNPWNVEHLRRFYP
jgi:hypothetical protein